MRGDGEMAVSEHVDRNWKRRSEKFYYVMTFGPRNNRTARKVKDVGHKQRAT